jgi:hypothetical protein
MYCQTIEKINKADEKNINEYIKNDILILANYEKN